MGPLIEVVDQVESVLNCVDTSLLVTAGHLFEGVVREPDRANETALGELCHRGPRFLQRDARVVRPVEEVDVEVIAAESFKALAACLQDLLSAEPAPAARDARTWSDLGRDEEFVAHFLQRRPDYLLVSRREVILGCVQPVDAGVDRRADDAYSSFDIGLLVWL